MLFGEYVTTIWWPNWDALAGPPGPDGNGLLLVATGSYSWGGLRLSATGHPVLAFPLAFKGRVVQYHGRILRPIQGKRSVEAHAYVDIAVPGLARMHDNRLTSLPPLASRSRNHDSADAQSRRQHSCRTRTDLTDAYRHTYPTI
jgi:hypothetical protein